MSKKSKLTVKLIKEELSRGLNSIIGIPRDRHEVFYYKGMSSLRHKGLLRYIGREAEHEEMARKLGVTIDDLLSNYERYQDELPDGFYTSSNKEVRVIDYVYQEFVITATPGVICLFITALASYIRQCDCTDIIWRSVNLEKTTKKKIDHYLLRLRFALGKHGEYFHLSGAMNV